MADTGIDEAQRAALAEIAADPKLGPIFEYWRGKCRDSGLPQPSDIDPAGIPPSILPYLTLLDVIDGGRTFRVRLVGTASAAAVGGDYTGRYLDETMSGDVLEAALDRYRAATVQRRPVLGHADYVMVGGDRVRNLLMTLPLSTDGAIVDRLLGVYSPRSDWLSRRALRNLDTAPYVTVKRSHIVL